MQLENKVALITGATSGIGNATAKLFLQEGAKVSLLGRNEDVLRSLAENKNSLAISTDVREHEECAAAVTQTLAAFDQIDILVNAAGIISGGTITDTSQSAWREMMQINLDCVFDMMQLCVPHLAKTSGNVVNVSSVTGTRAFPGVLAYCVSKAGVDQFTRCSALELAEKGVRVNAVNPGVVVTNLHRRGGFDEEKYDAFLEHSKTTHPLGRVGQPDEIAAGILYLASAQSGWVTGVTLNIDGGRHLTCAR